MAASAAASGDRRSRSPLPWRSRKAASRVSVTCFIFSSHERVNARPVRRRANPPPRSGNPTVTMIINVPRALISGLIEILSIDRIWVGMVSTPGGRRTCSL